jgi:phage FluMu gp28-like protein
VIAAPTTTKGFRGRAKNVPERDTFLIKYQSDWVKDTSLMKLMEKGRRIGISYASSYEDMRYHAQAESRLQTWVSSRDELTARQYVRDCMGFAKILHAAAKDMGEQVLEDANGKKHQMQVIQFANGQALHSLSSNPDAFAGRGGRVKLDEFALRKDPQMVYAIAGPTIDWGGSLGIISTHRGSGNYFNTLIREIKEKGNPKRFSYHRVTLQDALDQGFLWKLQCKLSDGDPRLEMDEADYFDYQKNRAADNETFLQEYMCVPADDAAAFIEFALLDGCSYAQGEKWELSAPEEAAGREIFGGLDIGRTNDLTSFTALEKVGGVLFTRKRIDLQKMTFSAQEEILYPWMAAMRRTCIDRTGLGMQFAERAAQRFGYAVEGVTFTGGTKEAMAYPVRSAFEDRAIRIPFDDDKLRSDIRAIRKETTAAGNVRFAADRGEDGHADRFWGLALAVHAAGSNAGNYHATLI